MKIRSRVKVLIKIDKHKSELYNVKIDLGNFEKLPLLVPKFICVIFDISSFSI